MTVLISTLSRTCLVGPSKKHVNIGEQRAEMVRTHLTVDKLYDVEQLKLAFVRLFPNIHQHEKRLASRFRPKRSNQVREVALEESDPVGSLAAEEEVQNPCLVKRAYIMTYKNPLIRSGL